MSERLTLIARLLRDRDYRASYIRAKLEVLIPSQLRALRQHQEKTQPELAQLAGMKQSRISTMETPGRVNFNLETLVRMAAALNSGLMVKFVPFSEMLGWENDYSQDTFNVTQLADDIDFLEPAASSVRKRVRRKRHARRVFSGVRIRAISVRAAGMGTTTFASSVQQERVQMNLQFEPPEPSSAQNRVAEVITMPKQRWSVLDDPQFLKTTAASAGARVSYGN